MCLVTLYVPLNSIFALFISRILHYLYVCTSILNMFKNNFNEKTLKFVNDGKVQNRVFDIFDGSNADEEYFDAVLEKKILKRLKIKKVDLVQYRKYFEAAFSKSSYCIN